MHYPAQLQHESDGGFTVTFRDIPEAITQGDTREEALSEAVGALVTAMDFYFEDGKAVPNPSKARKGEELIELPVSIASKVLLLNALVDRMVRPVDLARKMGVKPQEVTRIMDLHHATKIDTIADAFKALGHRLDVSVA